MYYSYVMGIDNSILALKQHDFTIENDGGNYQISFPKERAQKWEAFIKQHLKVGYWNEYLADNKIVFIFHLDSGFKRYEVENFDNSEVLNLCEKLCNCRFGSIKKMICDNIFYKGKVATNIEL